MQLTINIQNESLVDKIIKILEVFKNDGVQIQEQVVNNQRDTQSSYSDEYIEKHWKEILRGIKSDPDYYGSEQYKLDRGEYLMEKYQ